MDLFTFLVAVMMVAIALFYDMKWIVLLVLVLMVFTARSLVMVLLLIGVVGVLFVIQGSEMGYLWPLVLLALVVIAILLGLKSEPEQPEYFAPEMGGGGGFGPGGAF